MFSASDNSNDYFHQNVEAKRQQNLEDNRRFLAALKINDIREEIKEITENNENENNCFNGRRAVKKEIQSDVIRRSSRIRKNMGQNENLPPIEEKRKKKTTKNTDENQTHVVPRIKLQLPEHMLIRYQSTGRKVALHNTKAKFGDDDTENLLL